MIGGTKISTYNSQILTSTGFSSVDEFIGGGITNGSLFLLSCAPTSTYSDVLLRGYLSQGLTHLTHDICIWSADKCADDILKNLYEPIGNAGVEEKKEGGPPTRRASPLAAKDDKMKIAWRYQSLPKLSEEGEADNEAQFSSMPVRRGITMAQKRLGGLSISSGQNESYCAQFDITKLITKGALEKHTSQIFTAESVTDVIALLEKYTKESGRYLRICMFNASSPLYDATEVSRQLRLLKCSMIDKMASSMISLQISPFSKAQLNSIYHMCDSVIEMKTFASTDKSYFAKEYTGMMEVLKQPRVHRMLPPRCTINAQPVGVDKRFGFKCKRKKFSIEILCLPPELQENVSRTTSNSNTGGCSSDALSF